MQGLGIYNMDNPQNRPVFHARYRTYQPRVPQRTHVVFTWKIYIMKHTYIHQNGKKTSIPPNHLYYLLELYFIVYSIGRREGRRDQKPRDHATASSSSRSPQAPGYRSHSWKARSFSISTPLYVSRTRLSGSGKVGGSEEA